MEITLGLIVGNRGFFPDELCKDGREDMIAELKTQNIKVVALSPEETKFGAVETYEDAKKCADLFKQNRDKIDGVLVTLPNFGDERAVADTLRLAGLDVPVLIHAFGDEESKMTIAHRRDSFCGKISVCNNLRQYRIPFSLTKLHTVHPNTDSFRDDIQKFKQTCNVIKKLKNARIGALGARPTSFNTVRFSEKLLEAAGISVETLDLSEALGWANKMGDDDAAVVAKVDAIHNYTKTGGTPNASILKMAKLGIAIDNWTEDKCLSATAIQCWTSMEEFFGVVPCTIMSMMSNKLMPSACETDVAGLVGMYILQSASEKPSAILDWNNNYNEDPNKGVLFHCSNLPKDFFEGHKMDYQEIIAGSVGKENTFGTIVGRIAPGPFSYLRVSTDDLNGKIATYVGEGEFTKDNMRTFGGFGVFEIPRLQDLLTYICRNGFEHHVAANKSSVSLPIYEALTTYKNWDVYHHQ